MAGTAVCLFGPTASGKTDIAISLCKRFPFEVISVDSALVYRGLDIGTAKPDPEVLRRVPHRLIDIRDPEDTYSAGDFVRDARAAMADILGSGRIPLLVGGTMMYFRALTEGIAALPAADPDVRRQIDAQALAEGWPALHTKLQAIDPQTAARLNPNDSQRIQRALEVQQVTGQSLSALHREENSAAAGDFLFVKVGLQISARDVLHTRIEARLDAMLGGGFVAEVAGLMQRPGLHPDLPSMRAVGYRQIWSHLAGECSFDEARYRALVATRQLAKRQITWLRSERDVAFFDPLETRSRGHISEFLATRALTGT